jgi:hypothetical protein
MQNKPNLPDAQMNVSIFSKMDYENISDWTLGENKPNSKPIQTQFKPNQTQFQCQSNPIQTQSNPISKQLQGPPIGVEGRQDKVFSLGEILAAQTVSSCFISNVHHYIPIKSRV